MLQRLVHALHLQRPLQSQIVCGDRISTPSAAKTLLNDNTPSIGHESISSGRSAGSRSSASDKRLRADGPLPNWASTLDSSRCDGTSFQPLRVAQISADSGAPCAYKPYRLASARGTTTPKNGSQVRLRIKIDDQRIVATTHQQSGKIQRRRCFSTATLLIEHRNARHTASCKSWHWILPGEHGFCADFVLILC